MKTRESNDRQTRFIGITLEETYNLIESLVSQLNPKNGGGVIKQPFREMNTDGSILREIFIIINDN